MEMSSNNQIESNNLKIIKDQLEHEALMNKKFDECSNMVSDQQLKALFKEASGTHKQNFNSLKSYLDSHQ